MLLNLQIFLVLPISASTSGLTLRDFANFQNDATGFKPCDWNSPCPPGFRCRVRPEIDENRFYCYPDDLDFNFVTTPDFRTERPDFYVTPAPEIIDKSVDMVDRLEKMILDKDKAFREKIDLLNDMQCPDKDLVPFCKPCKSVNDCGQGTVCCPNSDEGRSCALPRDGPPNPTRVIQLIEGHYEVLSRQPVVTERTGSVALVKTQGLNILVDTGTSKQSADLEAALGYYGLSPRDMYTLILTHGHPDHYGNSHFFGVPKIFGRHRVSGNIFVRNEPTRDNRTYLCTRDAYILQTPGHTSDDVSLIVENVANYGVVAIVGDLFFYEGDNEGTAPWVKEAYNAKLQQQNRRNVICLADAILPGHGRIFDVTETMKRQAGCHRRK